MHSSVGGRPSSVSVARRQSVAIRQSSRANTTQTIYFPARRLPTPTATATIVAWAWARESTCRNFEATDSTRALHSLHSLHSPPTPLWSAWRPYRYPLPAPNVAIRSVPLPRCSSARRALSACPSSCPPPAERPPPIRSPASACILDPFGSPLLD
jgi:hypothetical protein